MLIVVAIVVIEAHRFLHQYLHYHHRPPTVLSWLCGAHQTRLSQSTTSISHRLTSLGLAAEANRAIAQHCGFGRSRFWTDNNAGRYVLQLALYPHWWPIANGQVASGELVKPLSSINVELPKCKPKQQQRNQRKVELRLVFAASLVARLPAVSQHTLQYSIKKTLMPQQQQ